MKIGLLVVSVIGLSVTCTTWANDWPSLGYANDMSEILLAGITRPLWTYTKFLSARPIRDTYGTVETPDNAGLVDPSDAAIFGETGGRTLNERAQARTP
jgi:hypothetical protein